jgi:hypothetical protein
MSEGPSSADLQRAAHSAAHSEPTTPINHAHGFPSAVDGQKTKLLAEEHTEVAGIKAESANVNNTISSTSGNLTNALFSAIQQHNMMNTDIAAIGDGTFFGPGNPGYGGLDFNLSGDVGAHNASLTHETELGEGLGEVAKFDLHSR